MNGPYISINQCDSQHKSLPTKNHKHCTFPVIWDSGASVCVTHAKSDFIQYNPISKIHSLSGFTAGDARKVKGEGYVPWPIEDTSGVLRTTRLKAYYIPTSSTCLIATNEVTTTYTPETIEKNIDCLTLSSVGNLNPIFVLINNSSNLPVFLVHRFKVNCSSIPNVPHMFTAAPSVVSDENMNLTSSEKELLR